MRFVINPFTDKLDAAQIGGSGAPPIETITGNTGGPVGPDPGTFNLNFIGDNTTGLTVSGNPGTFTLTIEGLASSTTQIGTTRYATNAEAAAQTIGTAALTPANITSLFSTHPLPSSQGGTGLSSPAAHSLVVTNGSSPFTVLGVASNGQIPIGSIGSDPVLGNITSTGGTITITNGPGTINIEASATGDVQTLTGNTGGAISPTGGNINTVGTGSITIAGSGSTLTTQLTGLTNHNVLVGAGTATITKVAPSATSGVPLVSQGAAADPTFGTAVVQGGGTGATTLTNHGVLLGQGTSAVVATAVGSTGTVLAGNTGADPTFQTIASVGGITTITGNSGGAESPSAGNFNILGTGSITVAGSANTETVQLTGLTNHNVLVGAGTATITNVAPSATSGVPLISQGASADPTFGTAVVAGGGTGATSFTAHSLLLGQGTSPVTALGAATNGQIPIGSTGVDPVLATITQGTGITVTNGAGTITIATTISQGIVTINGDSGSVTGTTVTLTGGTTGLTFGGVSTTMTMAGTLVVSNGGTGRATLTNHGVLVGAGTSAITQLAVGATGTVLAGSTGADPSFTATPSLTSVTFGSGTALNTYQEGTWTPTLTFGGGSTGITYTAQVGTYTRIGRMVLAQFNVALSNKGSSTGTASITGLPYTSITTTSSGTYIPCGNQNITYPVGTTMIAVVLGANSSSLTPTGLGTATGNQNLADTNFANNSILQGTIMYQGQ